MAEPCTWCGTAVPEDDGFRVAEPEEQRKAVFCRLEHVVPWIIQGAGLGVRRTSSPPASPTTPSAAARCAATRSASSASSWSATAASHRIGDAFCRLEHLEDWAKGGGRYKAAS